MKHPKSISANTRCAPGNRYFVNAKPFIAPSAVEMKTAGMTTISVEAK